MSLRLVFMGTPDFAVPTLLDLAARGHDIVAVYARAPGPAGRGLEMQPTPVEREAWRLSFPIHTPKTLKDAAAQHAFSAHGADVAVVVAYGLLLPQPILDAPRLGCFNLHGSILPRWRGAAPIHRAVMAGDRITGVQVMKMEAGLDTGPVMKTAITRITEDDTTGDIHDQLSHLGARLMVKALTELEAGPVKLTPQTEDGVTIAAKVTPAEARIDWTRPAPQVSAHIRGLSPHPGAWFELDGQRIKALHARAEDGSGPPGEVLDDNLLIACGEGAVRLTRLQRAGKG